MGINVSSTITINSDVLQELSDIGKQALVKTADALLTQVKNTQVMPFDTGTLQNDSTFVDTSDVENGNVRIVSSTPYARRWYFNPESVYIRAHKVREYTIKNGKRAGTVVRAHDVRGHTADKAYFNTQFNGFANDHWFRFWQSGGSRSDFTANTFAFYYRRLLKNALRG